MKLLLMGFAVGAGLAVTAAGGQGMPGTVLGTWRIVKVLPTHNASCWDGERAKTLVGSTLRYRVGRMVWQGGEEEISVALTRTLSRRKFQDEYNVDLTELGIAAPSVREIDLQHEDADVTGATTEVPGDTIVPAGPGRIVVSACGVFYAAIRVAGRR